jgi:hypothetical protein
MKNQRMTNLLLEDITYKIENTDWGVWRRFMYPTGELFEEFTSHKRLFGLLMFHYTRGRCPETGKRIVARGIIAVGRLALGVIAIGHASAGIIAVGQASLGILFGLGQAAAGLFAVGQLAIALIFGLGQIASGYIAVGQFAVGGYVLAQVGLGWDVWDARGASPGAQTFFSDLKWRVLGVFER